ncbi:MAG TPA: orotidine-5'-phosphate decarboxylase [Polyangiaceae bacterium]|nr:orotidine-5'-phosphate decarboxylase [Polyangiaceae bacterium]
MTAPRDRLAFPLDYPTLDEARRGAERVVASTGVLKVGLELFVREGPAAVRLGEELGAAVFLDLKLHDIPETVDRAVASAANFGVRYLTVHAAGGPRMLEAAAKRVEREKASLTLLAVTVLTSLDDNDLRAIGCPDGTGPQALRLARLAVDNGIGGLVCSAAEVRALREAVGPGVVLVTPGIRPADNTKTDDQKRVGTPAGAIRDGSSVLVVGRPIRDAADPAQAARRIVEEIALASG